MTTRSTAPIALLTAAGLVCLAATTLLTPTTETHQAPPDTSAGEHVTATATTTTDPLQLVLSITLIVLAAVAFVLAGWLAVRRLRLKRAAQRQS